MRSRRPVKPNFLFKTSSIVYMHLSATNLGHRSLKNFHSSHLFPITVAFMSTIHPSTYSCWKQSSEDPSIWQRRTVGTESTWILKPKITRQIYVFCSLVLESAFPKSELSFAVEKAWIRLRLNVPEIVLRSYFEKKPETSLQYQAPESSEEEFQAWADKTLKVELCAKSLDFLELRTRFTGSSDDNLTGSSDDNNSASLCVSGQTAADGNDSVQKCQIMLCVDHLVTDGIGARIIFGKYLTFLASALSGSLEQAIREADWPRTDPGAQLLPPWTACMNKEQLLSGPEFEKQVAENEKNLARIVIFAFRKEVCRFSPYTDSHFRITVQDFRLLYDQYSQSKKSISSL